MKGHKNNVVIDKKQQQWLNYINVEAINKEWAWNIIKIDSDLLNMFSQL